MIILQQQNLGVTVLCFPSPIVYTETGVLMSPTHRCLVDLVGVFRNELRCGVAERFIFIYVVVCLCKCKVL